MRIGMSAIQTDLVSALHNHHGKSDMYWFTSIPPTHYLSTCTARLPWDHHPHPHHPPRNQTTSTSNISNHHGQLAMHWFTSIHTTHYLSTCTARLPWDHHPHPHHPPRNQTSTPPHPTSAIIMANWQCTGLPTFPPPII